MATVQKNPTHLEHKPTKPRQEDDPLRRDRYTAIVVMVFMMALMALMMWLASLGGGPVEPTDYWPMIP